MALELLSDECIGRAHEVKDLDDLPIARHCASGCEPDRRAHRHDHKREKGGRKNNDSIGHRAKSRGPNPVVVEIGLRNGRGKRFAQRVEVLGSLGHEA